jgi:hypothetical protein
MATSLLDCSCTPPDAQIFEDPENILDGFLFKLPAQAHNPDAPVYYVPSVDARTAFRMGHTSQESPALKLKDEYLGLPGKCSPESCLLNRRSLRRHR